MTMMKKVVLLLVLLFICGLNADSKCDICLKVVKSIQETNYLEYMANLSTQQIRSFIQKQVKAECSGSSDCTLIARTLIVNADQLDFDDSFTPEILCEFTKLCSE